ncbi:MAG: hypothetical protein GY809_01235 [Planctomycetes bacterium]|nr:hypothetical protein [Planctomycetota bacterium]
MKQTHKTCASVMINPCLPKHLLVCVLLFVLPHVVQATWYKENVQNGCDIIMMDVRWPWWPSGTYYANWNSSFNPKPNNVSFYAGFPSYAPDGPGYLPNLGDTIQTSYRPGNVWTFWGGDVNGSPVRFTDVAPNLFIKNDYGAEGSSGTMGSEVWPFVTCKQWYTMLGRVWQPVGGGDHAFVGRWIKDHGDGRWHMIGMARLPIPATSFTGNSGFIETLSDGRVVRPLHRRLGYFRKEGRWLKSDTLTINKTNYVVVNTITEGDHEYVAIEYANRPDFLPQHIQGEPLDGDAVHSFQVRQPDLPVLDQPAVTNVRAETTGSQVAVSWQVPDTASPAFSYRIEVFDNSQCQGTAEVVKEERMPTARLALIDTSVTAPTIRLTVTDIFDQAAAPVIVTAEATPKPESVEQITASVPGLMYELFHKDSKRHVNHFTPALQKPNESHHWLTLDEMSQGTLFRRGLARGFDLSVRGQRKSGYAMMFQGLLRVPVQGLYLFHSQIDGAYRIRIDGKDVLVWDGQHGTTEKAAIQLLARGDHVIEVSYLYDQLHARNFSIEWQGPGLARQPIPLTALRTARAGQYPVPSLTAESPGDGTGHVTVSVNTRGHDVNKITLFLGHLQLAQNNGPNLEYEGPLPRGENTLWSRVLFDGNLSVDSETVTLDVTGKPVSQDWTVRNVGDAKASAGLWQTGEQAFQFFGQGMHIVTKEVTGDFTATCRIDHYNGSKGEPVNRHAWVGLGAREYGDRLNWGWGRDFHLVQTAANGVRASADFSDLASTRVSSYPLARSRPWLRIVRQGQVWTAWTSVDGTQWELGAHQFKKTRETMHVGLFFSALPQDSLAHYQARVSELSIVPGAATESTPPLPATARHTGGDRLTGVVMADTDSQVVVLRTSHAGLLRTTNGGKTWSPANGNLSGADLAVRSVAIHPEDPLTMLRACGRGTAGGLWKTIDGGDTWSRLNLTCDFDGVGPSALCGEVVAFDLKTPSTIYVGCESKGFFKSGDGGITWVLLDLVGQRITSVTVWPWAQYYPDATKGRTELCVTTCTDRWMACLGRGNPSVVTGAAMARIYITKDNVQSLRLLDERGDTGFYNAAWDKSLNNTRAISFATSHGYQGNSGGFMSLFPAQKHLEWLRPFTALGTTATGDRRQGRFLTQALDPVAPGRLSLCVRGWGMNWSWLPTAGSSPKGGLIAACGDIQQGDRWWFVYTDGLYTSPDGGVTLHRVLDAQARE